MLEKFQDFNKRKLNDDGESARAFFKYAKTKSKYHFEESIVSRYLKNPNFVEIEIIKNMFSICNIHLCTDYRSLYCGDINVTSQSHENETEIITDELLIDSLLSFILTICSFDLDQSLENFKRCVKNCIVILDLQGRHNVIGTHNIKDIEDIILSLPPTTLNVSMDIYWATWTFIIGHELHHLLHNNAKKCPQDELDADVFGHKKLLQMIVAQKQGNIPSEISVFHEYTYLSPLIFMEFLDFIDEYKSWNNDSVDYTLHPSPAIRKANIINMMNLYIPESIDTNSGNEVLNIFLERKDELKEQIFIKKKLGKLKVIEDFTPESDENIFYI